MGGTFLANQRPRLFLVGGTFLANQRPRLFLVGGTFLANQRPRLFLVGGTFLANQRPRLFLVGGTFLPLGDSICVIEVVTKLIVITLYNITCRGTHNSILLHVYIRCTTYIQIQSFLVVQVRDYLQSGNVIIIICTHYHTLSPSTITYVRTYVYIH